MKKRIPPMNSTPMLMRREYRRDLYWDTSKVHPRKVKCFNKPSEIWKGINDEAGGEVRQGNSPVRSDKVTRRLQMRDW